MKPFTLVYPLALPLATQARGRDEKSQLSKVPPNAHAAVDVKSLRYEYASSAADSTRAAFDDDPLHNYLRGSAKDERRLRGIYKTNTTLQLVIAIRSREKMVFTVADGEANVIGTRSKSESGGSSPVDELIQRIGRVYSTILGKVILSKEQKKRFKEVTLKLEDVVKNTLGEKVDDMLYVDLLATSPTSQGKGYGSALVAAVTSMADLQNRTTFLLSSNIRNTAFYNSCGFTTVASAVIGDSNPSWNASPVTVPLMVRKPSKITNPEVDIMESSGLSVNCLVR